MKALRIAQVIALVLVAIYVLLFHNANPGTVEMPLVGPVPPSLLVAVVGVVAWLIGWLPGRLRNWRLERKVAATQAERDALSTDLARARRSEPSDPIIPDRASGGLRPGDDPTDYL
ncbi:MAG: hypothetical protein ACNA8N_04235 [Trueperaceae bacterium]